MSRVRRASRSSRRPELSDFAKEFPGSREIASRAIRELEVVGALVESRIAGVARRHGLSHAAVNALAVIEGAGGPIPAGEIAQRMHITSGTTTSLLDTLERKSYVRRVVDPDDRRRVLVDVTPDAQKVLDAVLPQIQQVAKAIMENFGDGELQSMLDALARIRETVAATPDDLPPAKRNRPKHLTRRDATD